MELVGFTAAVLDLLKFSKACLDLYEEAKLNTPQTHFELVLRLEAQAITFDRWCSVLGLKEMIQLAVDDKDWRNCEEFAIFQQNLKENLRFENEQVARLIVDVLKGLTAKFEDARGRLPINYAPTNIGGTPQNGHTNPIPTHATSLPVSSTPISLSTATAKASWKPWKRHQAKDTPSPPERSQPQRATILQTTKFLLRDKKIFIKLLDEVKAVNESLLTLLGQDLQSQIKRRFNLQLLGNNNRAHLEAAQNIPADTSAQREIGVLATIKTNQLFEEDSFRSGTENGNLNALPVDSWKENPLKSPIWHADDFDRGALQVGPARAQVALQGKQVLIEWKSYNSSNNKQTESVLRLASLVAMLSKPEVARFSHIPHCRGLIKDETNSRIGMIFSFPTPRHPSSTLTYGTLQDFIRQRSTPAVGRRFHIAKDLSMAVCYLQSVHWLHKLIRSDNVIYFNEKDVSDPVNGMGAQPQDMAHESKDFPSFSLVAFDLSRPDHPSESTESISVSTSGYKSRRRNMVLYSHPDWLTKNSANEHQRFRPEFDVYSLGLILLEVGLWRTLHHLRERTGTDHDFRVKAREEYCNELKAKMGDIYWDAARRCLNNDFDLVDAPHGTEEGTAFQLAFERQVISQLEKCHV
jgi:Prion-inhibition and propagation